MITIHECTFPDIRCDSYNCQNHRGYRKFYIGREDGPISKATFCEPCIRHMLETMPLEFAGANVQDHAAKLEEALKNTMQSKLAEQKAQLEAVFRGQYEALLASQPEPEAAKAPVVVDEPAVATKKTYRCLDCGADFKTAANLGSHRSAKHKEE